MGVGGLVKAGKAALKQGDVLDTLLTAPVAKAKPARQGDVLDDLLVEEIDIGDTPLPDEDPLDSVLRQAFDDPQDEQAAINALDDQLAGVETQAEIPKDPIIEHFDLDREFIGIKNQNAPDSVFETGAADQVEWVRDLDDEEIKALNVMSHVRGVEFPQIKDKIIRNNYDRDANNDFPSREVVEGMRDMDVAAINFYTRSGDSILNDVLRSGDIQEGSEVEAAINAVDTALDNLPSWDPADGLLYRTVDRNRVEGLDSELQLEPGDIVSDPGYTSTTRDQLYNPETKEFSFEGTPAPGYFVITPKANGKGKPIEGLSDWGRQEAEVLYERGAKFRFIRKETSEKEVMMFQSPNEIRTTTIFFVEEI